MPSDVLHGDAPAFAQSDSGKLVTCTQYIQKRVVDVCVAQARQEEFYDALDAMNCYQTKILLFAEDTKIKDPKILEQIQS